MIENKMFKIKKRPLISVVPRPTATSNYQNNFFHSEINTPSTLRTNQHIYGRTSSNPLEEIALETKPHIHARVRTPLDNHDTRKKTNKVSSFDPDKGFSVNSEDILNAKVNKPSNNSEGSCLKNLTPNQILVLKLLVIFLLISIVSVAAIFTPIYMLIIRRFSSQSSFTNITASVCSSTTCIIQETPYRTSMVTALYQFDGNPNDWTGSGTGALLGTPTPVYSNSPYIGIQALSLNYTNSQHVQISNINLTQRSFTVEVWLYVSGISLLNDLAIFGQCDSSSICLAISLRNGRFTVSFDSMNTNSTLTGTSIMLTTSWIHLAVVYDATLYQRQIYVNGIIDIVSTGMAAPYQGSSSGQITTIGKTLSLAYGTSFFNGRIDHVTISAGYARTACQIYNDATLTAYYPFETVDTFNDRSVNLFNGISFGTTTTSQGAIGGALYFPSSTSYFQAQCYSITKGANSSYSYSLWINPDAIGNGGTIIHFSNAQTGGGTCYEALVLTSTGELVAQWMQSATVVSSILGPVAPANTWTHVAIVLTAADGIRFYVNGQLDVFSSGIGGTNTASFSSPQYITLGNYSPSGPSPGFACRNGTIPIRPGAFTGGIDEFRFYNRELSSQEICVLANL